MKRYSGVLVAWGVLVLAACGGAGPAESAEGLAQSEAAIVSCSAECASGFQLSCLGETCSASNGAYVECDGAYQFCEPSQPEPACLLLSNHCGNIAGTACSRNATRECCLDGQLTGDCFCSFNKWACSVQRP
ncbi:hypothetical protein LZ198_32345 [Myxococcus sp. K15C18031901]|uniref:hypothetical protein n=1 Tax=Myxococcus dinghuensis TaxID=2906761 RepID=UPI0020A7DB8B|nr:hypothetical protein [Myxococcus dinghuensis]MCP3103584.1 hypothetical protein [Myxococcus dinghuensis]